MGYADEPFRAIRIEALIFEDGRPRTTDVAAWCGHRWNTYGVLPHDMLRVSHCAVCSEADIRHLVVIVGRMDTAELRRFKTAYRSPHNTSGSDQLTPDTRRDTWRAAQAQKRTEALRRCAVDGDHANGSSEVLRIVI